MLDFDSVKANYASKLAARRNFKQSFMDMFNTIRVAVSL